jgi:putative FmdB family regulatory protein
MPTYQYRCEKCGKKFERTETISEHEAEKSKCPKCGSKKVSYVPGNVYVVTPKRASAWFAASPNRVLLRFAVADSAPFPS